MRDNRLLDALIDALLRFFPAACNIFALPEHEPVISLSEPDIYPARVFPQHDRSVCIDMGIPDKTPEVESVSPDESPVAELREAFPYTNARGEGRFCACLAIRPGLKPDTHDIPLSIVFSNNALARINARVEIAEPGNVAADTGSETRIESALDGVSDSPLLSGNRVEVLDDGQRAFDVWYDLIASAGKTIHLQTYYLDEGGESTRLVELLKAKAKEGVDVRLIITRYSQLAKSPLTYFDLKQQGVEVLLVGDIGFPHKVESPVSKWYQRMQNDYRIFKDIPEEEPFRQWEKERGQLMIDYALHEKMLVVDGEKAIAGGRNLSDCYFFWWKDLDVLLTGPIVDELERTFGTNWSLFNGSPLVPGKPRPAAPTRQGIRARLVQSRPWDGRYANLDALVNAVNAARSRVYLTSQYLALPDRLKDALCAAALRGVDMRILTNSFETGWEVTMSLCHFISLNYYRDLLKSGVRIYEYSCNPKQKRRPYCHAKEVMIDGACTAIGSFNLSLRSAYLESELMIYLFDRALTSDREKRFRAELAQHGREIFFTDLAMKEHTYGRLMEMARKVEILY